MVLGAAVSSCPAQDIMTDLRLSWWWPGLISGLRCTPDSTDKHRAIRCTSARCNHQQLNGPGLIPALYSLRGRVFVACGLLATSASACVSNPRRR